MNDADRFDHWIDPTPTRLTTGCGYRRLRGPSGVGERRLRLRAVNGGLHETKTCARGASVTWALVIGVGSPEPFDRGDAAGDEPHEHAAVGGR